MYSDHEIFLRELVSNAVDATQKLKTLAATGDFKGELGDLTVRVKVDKENGTITISDRGLGMTAEEIDKYINQIASQEQMTSWKIQGRCQCHHRSLRSGILFSLHGSQDGRHRNSFL